MGESNRDEIAKLEALYANNPGGRVFTHLAEAYRKAGDLDLARKILEDGLVRHADSASAHVVLGRVLLDQGVTAEASSAFRRVLELDPENRVALRTLGDLNHTSGNRNEALDYYRKLQHLDPGDDDLGQLIDTLANEPEPEAAPEVPVAAAEQPATTAAAEAAEPEPEPVTASAPAEPAQTEVGDHPEPEPAEVPQAGTADFALDWTAAEPETAEPLPGDLAQFAEEAQAPAEPELAEPAAETSIAAHYAHEEAVESEAVAEPQPAEEAPWAAAAAQPPVEHKTELKAEAGPELSEAGAETTSAETTEDEPWSELPSTFEEPEPWTPALELTQQDLEPWQAEPWTESVDLSTGLTAESVDTGLSEDLGSMDLSVDPSAEEAREPSFEEMLSSNQASAQTPDEDLPTETLAELYRTQGFYDRAREVYKALLEARPDDVRLQARLREIEHLERGAAASPTAPEPAQGDEEAREAWMAGVASGWTGEQTAPRAGAPSLYSWTDETAEGPNGIGPTLREYLSRLLAWRPGSAQRAKPAVEEPVPVAPEEASITEAEREVEPALDIEYDVPVLTLDEEVQPEEELAVSLMEWQAPEPGPDEISEPAPEPELHLEEIVSEPEPPAPAPVAAAPARASTGNPIDDAFDEWFDGGTAPAAQPAVEHVAAEKRAEEPAAARATLSERAESVDESAPTAEESDDDLEMFRSWLQSLKR